MRFLGALWDIIKLEHNREGQLLLWAFVFALAVWLEWKRNARENISLRLSALILLFLGIAGLIWQPAIRQMKPGQKIILVTDHYAERDLQSLVAKQDSTQMVYMLRGQNPPQEGLRIVDVYDLLEQFPDLGEVWILGKGLDADQLKALEGIRIHYVPSVSNLEGISSIDIPKRLVQGKAYELMGHYQMPDTLEKRWLYLSYQGAVLDSVLIQNKTEASFVLSFTPKVKGFVIFDLTAQNKAGKVFCQEKLALKIEDKPGFKILFLNSSPSFETKYLKNYLAAQGHQVWVRSQISRERFKDDLNNTQEAIGNLAPAFLNRLDLIVIDQKYLNRASANLQNWIGQAVKDYGASLWLQITGEPSPWNPIPILQTSFKQGTVRVKTFRAEQLPNMPPNGAMIEPLGQGFISQAWDEKLVSSPQREVLAIARVYGQGKLGTSLIPETYPWLLEGFEDTYKAYWASIFDKLLGQVNPQDYWQLNEPVFEDQKVDFYYKKIGKEVYHELQTPAQAKIALALAQDPYLNHRWQGRFWPEQSGWHILREPHESDSLEKAFFVYPAKSWSSLRLARQKKINQLAAVRSSKSLASAAPRQFESYRGISRFWFYALALLGMGILWIEPKL